MREQFSAQFKAIGKEDVKKDNPDGSIEGLDRWGSIY